MPRATAPRSSAVHPKGSRPESRPSPAQWLPSGTRQNPPGLSHPWFRVPRPVTGRGLSRGRLESCICHKQAQGSGTPQSALGGPFFVDSWALMPWDSPPLRKVQAARVPRGWRPTLTVTLPSCGSHRASPESWRGVSHSLPLLLAQWGQAGPRQTLPPAARPAPGWPEQTAALLGLSGFREPSVTEPPQLCLGPSICHPFPNSFAGDGPWVSPGPWAPGALRVRVLSP